MSRCLHFGCLEPAVPGCAHGFRFCTKHLSIACHHVPLPAGFIPMEGVEPIRKTKWNGGRRGGKHHRTTPQLSDHDQRIRALLTMIPGRWAHFPRTTNMKRCPYDSPERFRNLKRAVAQGVWDTSNHTFHTDYDHDTGRIIIKCEEKSPCQNTISAA